MKLLISYKGYAGVSRRAEGTPEELGEKLVDVLLSKAKGRITRSAQAMYAKNFADELRADAEEEDTREIILSGLASPFKVGRNAGRSDRYSIPVIVLDVRE